MRNSWGFWRWSDVDAIITPLVLVHFQFNQIWARSCKGHRVWKDRYYHCVASIGLLESLRLVRVLVGPGAIIGRHRGFSLTENSKNMTCILNTLSWVWWRFNETRSSRLCVINNRWVHMLNLGLSPLILSLYSLVKIVTWVWNRSVWFDRRSWSFWKIKSVFWEAQINCQSLSDRVYRSNYRCCYILLVLQLFDVVLVLGSCCLIFRLRNDILCGLWVCYCVKLFEGVDVYSLFIPTRLASTPGAHLIVDIFDILVLLTFIIVLWEPVESVASTELRLRSERVRKGVWCEVCSIVCSVGAACQKVHFMVLKLNILQIKVIDICIWGQLKTRSTLPWSYFDDIWAFLWVIEWVVTCFNKLASRAT